MSAPIEVDDEVAVASGFAIVDDATASWVVGKILACDEELQRIEAQHAVIVAAVKRRKAALEARFGAELRGYAAQRLEGGRTRTLHLPTGSCAFRVTRGGPRIVDEQLALAWAIAALPAAVRTPEPRPVLIKDEVKAYVEMTGIVPPGVDVIDDVDAFTVKAAAQGK